ncbi:uncharacterized protein SYNPCC7002_A1590-like [Zingiber officinale]|uniref:uncharacterized protein SYNPCC7002_A1590-like n=1 Tax=Zingiber officinale TaxID=94328 RepID=UPI001C4AB9A7|nr:uncharacterized protein SYNPCC7002_A1590-like [Zingiber officinale]
MNIIAFVNDAVRLPRQSLIRCLLSSVGVLSNPGSSNLRRAHRHHHKPSPSLKQHSELRRPHRPSMALHYASAPPRLGSATVAAPARRVRSTASVLASASASIPKARFAAKRIESATVQQLQRPLAEYMTLPASQYSVLDAERIERIDDKTFRCYVYRLKFFSFEVCPVLVVRVDEEPNGCCIRLLSCKLEGSPLVEAQNEKFSASMVNRISCSDGLHNSTFQKLTTDTDIEVTIDIPFAFRMLPVEVFESTGRQVLEQLLRAMLPRFLAQLIKDYQAWASGDTSRQPLGTGQI